MKQIALLGAAMLLLSGFKDKDEAPTWANVGWWTVRVDQSVGNGCFLAANYEGDTVIRLGFDARTNVNGYLVLSNERWASLEIGKDYKLAIQFDDEDPWNAPATVIPFNGKSLHVSFTNSDFIDEFMRKQGVKVEYEGREIANLELKDSAEAGRQLMACQAAMNALPKNGDPFAPSAKQTSDDPFSR